MKKRKLLAILLTLTMVMGSAITVNAADEEDDGSIGESTITGSGSVDYFDTTVYEVNLPTDSGTFNLLVDPQGLAGLEAGESASLDELSGGAGLISSTEQPYVINASSVDMKVSVAMTLTTDAEVVTEEAAVEDPEGAENILLYAIPSSTAVTSTDDTGTNASGYTAGTTGIVISGTEATVDFLVPAADYEFSKAATEDGGALSYDRTDDPSHGIGLTFAGKVNTQADWSAYAGAEATKDISLEVVFSFAPADDTDELPETPAASYMMEYEGDVVPLEATQPEEPETDDFVMEAGEDGSVSYTFVDAPEGALTKIIVGSTERTGQISTNNITYADGVLTFNAAALSACKMTTAGTYTIKATIGSNDPITLTYTKQ